MGWVTVAPGAVATKPAPITAQLKDGAWTNPEKVTADTKGRACEGSRKPSLAGKWFTVSSAG